MKIKKTIVYLILSVFFLSFNWSDYKFYKLDGQGVTYNELLKNYPQVVFFLWSGWCHYCRNTLRQLNKGKLTYKNIKFYYVNLGENKETVEKIINMLNLNSDIRQGIILDEKAVMADKFNVLGIPTYIFLRKGKFLYKTHFIDRDTIKSVFKEQK